MTAGTRRGRASRSAVAALVAVGLNVLAGCSDDDPDRDIPREPFPQLEDEGRGDSSP